MATLEMADKSPSFTVSNCERAIEGSRTISAKAKGQSQTDFVLLICLFDIAFSLRSASCPAIRSFKAACNTGIPRMSMQSFHPKAVLENSGAALVKKVQLRGARKSILRLCSGQ